MNWTRFSNPARQRFDVVLEGHLAGIERRLAGMQLGEHLTTPERAYREQQVVVHRAAAGWLVRLGTGDVSVAKSPRRVMFYVRDRLRLLQERKRKFMEKAATAESLLTQDGLLGIVEDVNTLARENARETEGIRAAGGIDTAEGVLSFVIPSAESTVWSLASDREFRSYALLDKPLTVEQADAVVLLIRQSYGVW